VILAVVRVLNTLQKLDRENQKKVYIQFPDYYNHYYLLVRKKRIKNVILKIANGAIRKSVLMIAIAFNLFQMFISSFKII
jgi:hypothetical protein